MKTLGVLTLGLTLTSSAFAQTPARPADARETHYQIGVMERVLEGAVEHGAANLRERLQAIAPDAPAQLLILGSPRVRGFRLDGYGVFFDVDVPSLNGTLTWSLRTLDPGTGTVVSVPVPAGTVKPILPNPRRPGGLSAGAPDRAVGAAAAKPAPDTALLDDPNEAYRTEVVQALKDAMLDYSGPLAIGADEWMTVAARGIQDRPRMGSADSDGQTVMVRARGADLAAFRSGQLSRDDAMNRIERRVF